MKLADIAGRNNWNPDDLRNFAAKNGYDVKMKILGAEVNDRDADAIIARYSQHLAQEQAKAAQEQAKAEAEAQKKQAALASMLITSGFNFDGYTIKKYSGYISGDDAVEVEREQQGLFSGRRNTAGEGLMAALVEIRRNALHELKEAAYALGCNAVIGVDFDYITLDPQTATHTGGTLYLPYIFGVTANGNAVVIEKNSQ
ncbi:heavy metal-binding domain-containing protein [Adlercreutzia sp. ZJ242]|uniref:heavy metal-binding domain-containing protein n=1 Tax=Adlercreutzia sp. ZJ242 TaxID=2709409 RepID=UPI0013EB49C2|nr:heavy metal-binding domain-containing protein [Adlercreutzia sp. ZJ242]